MLHLLSTPLSNNETSPFREQLISAKRVAQDELNSLRRVLDSLDELGEIISEILESQQAVEVSAVNNCSN